MFPGIQAFDSCRGQLANPILPRFDPRAGKLDHTSTICLSLTVEASIQPYNRIANGCTVDICDILKHIQSSLLNRILRISGAS